MSEDDQKMQLVRKRGVIKAQSTRFTNYVKGFTENDLIEHLQVRLEKYELLYDEFDEVQTAIENLSEDDQTNANDVERKRFEDSYYLAVANTRKLIKTRTADIAANASASPATPTTTTPTEAVRLPIINLPEFDGKYENWYRFKEAFNTLVDDNAALSNVQKFIYLTSSLKGSAVETIEALEITGNNYPVALNLLKERYDNKKLIINTHIRAIFDLEAVQRENHAALRKLLDQFLKHYRALEALRQPVQHWDTLLIHILTNKIDTQTRRSWETTQTTANLPILRDLIDFLKGRCQVLETTYTNVTNTLKPHLQDKTIKYKALAHVAQTQGNCSNCKGSHSIYRCTNFIKLTTQERKERARSLNLCTNCLAQGHSVEKCRSRRCYKCSQAHHTLLHTDEEKETVKEMAVTTHCVSATTHGILSTAYVDIEADNGTKIKARALIDSGSDSNYITSELHDKLRSETENCAPVTIMGVNGTTSKVTKRTSATIRAINSDYKRKMTFLVINKITQDIPLIRLNAKGVEIPKAIKLADDTWHTPSKIDILIGVEAFYELIQDERIYLGKHKPVLRETKLGWILTGSIDAVQTNNRSTCNVAITNEQLDEGLQRFWSTEENGVMDARETICEEHCEKHFRETTRRDEEGRYVVTLPFNERKEEIGKSLEGATNRF